MNHNTKPAKRGRGMKRGAAVAVLLAVAALGAAYVMRRGPGDPASKDAVFAVARGPLTINVTETGSIKAREQIVLKNDVEGRTTILFLVPEGTQARKGDLLVELDASTLMDQRLDQQIRVQNADAAYVQARENLAVVENQAKSDVDKAELDLQFAREDLKQYIEGKFPKELKEADAKINLASEELQRAQDKYKWSLILFEEKYLSQTELKADELSAKKAELDLELAIDSRNLLTEFTYQRQLAQLESDVSQFEMALERTRRRAAADVVQAEANLRAKESEFKQQQDKLTKLDEQIAKAKIFAPTDGLVVYATSARADWRGNSSPLAEGSEVREREELIYLPTADSFMAEVKVHESNLEKIRVGLPVRLTVDAVPGRVFTGRVTKVAPLPDAQSMFMNPDLKVYNTEIHLDGSGGGLRTGMSCLTEIIVEQYDDALYVPVQAVVRVNGKPTVYTPSVGGSVPRPVQIGLDNNRMVRVIDGLREGERVLLSPPLDQGAVESATETLVAQRDPQALRDRDEAARDAEARDGEARDDAVRDDATPEAAPEMPSGAAPGDALTAMDEQQREQMRERFRNMTPEERERARAQFGGGGPGARGSGSPRGDAREPGS